MERRGGEGGEDGGGEDGGGEGRDEMERRGGKGGGYGREGEEVVIQS